MDTSSYISLIIHISPWSWRRTTRERTQVPDYTHFLVTDWSNIARRPIVFLLEPVWLPCEGLSGISFAESGGPESNFHFYQLDILLYFSDYKTPPQIWEETGGASYRPNIAYLAHWGEGSSGGVGSQEAGAGLPLLKAHGGRSGAMLQALGLEGGCHRSEKQGRQEHSPHCGTL